MILGDGGEDGRAVRDAHISESRYGAPGFVADMGHSVFCGLGFRCTGCGFVECGAVHLGSP